MTISCMQTRREFPQPFRQDLHTAEINRQNAGCMRTFQIARGVADHPYRVIRGNSRAVQSQVDRIGCRLVALGVLGAHRPGYPPAPAKMGQFGAEVLADLVAHDGDVTTERRGALQQTICTRQRLQPLEVDAVEGLVEHLLRLASPLAEQLGKMIAQRAVRPVAHFLVGPSRQAERVEGVVIALDDGRPGIDQGVVPVEQDRPRPLDIGRPAHVTASPSEAKRTYSSRRRRAVGPTLPSPTLSPSIFTTGVTNDVALVMKASFAFFASVSENGRSTNLSCRSLAIFFSVPRVMPARMPLSVWRVTSSLSPVTIQALVEAPSVMEPLSSISQAS